MMSRGKKNYDDDDPFDNSYPTRIFLLLSVSTPTHAPSARRDDPRTVPRCRILFLHPLRAHSIERSLTLEPVVRIHHRLIWAYLCSRWVR